MCSHSSICADRLAALARALLNVTSDERNRVITTATAEILRDVHDKVRTCIRGGPLSLLGRRPLPAPFSNPKPDADEDDSRCDEPEPDADELGLDSRDAVRHADVLRGLLGSDAVREHQVVRPGTWEIGGEGTGGAVHGK